MAFNSTNHNVGASSSNQFFITNGIPNYSTHGRLGNRTSHRRQAPSFDILEWYPSYQSCQRYFLDHAQHSSGVQALASFVNIKLPYQWMPYPVVSTLSDPSQRARSNDGAPHLWSGTTSSQSGQVNAQAQGTSLFPYIRRLVATGHDSPAVLHGFFGDDWRQGIGPSHEIERRNFLFAAKSVPWAKVRGIYDMSPEESVPFLSPLKMITEEEILAAERSWSEWLLMQDWMMGPRAPTDDVMEGGSPQVKMEHEDA